MRRVKETDDAEGDVRGQGELVSEDQIDVDESGLVEEEGASSPEEEVAQLDEVVSTLVNQGVRAEIDEFRSPSGVRRRIRLELPAGRDTRVFRLSLEDAMRLLKEQPSAWQSLERLDGIWSPFLGEIEVAVAGERFGPSPFYYLQRLSGRTGPGSMTGVQTADEWPGIEFRDDMSGVTLQLGPSSNIGSILLAQRGPSRLQMSVRITGVSVSRTAEAEAVAEKVTDSLSVAIDAGTGLVLLPRRLERMDRTRGRGRRVSLVNSFPRNSYPHEAVLLYQAGRSRMAPPLVRYWSLYQVLEYFFPRYELQDAVQAISRSVRSPDFDPHSEEAVLRLAQSALKRSKGSRSEMDQLVSALRAITSPGDLVDEIVDLGLEEVLAKKSELSECRVKSSDTEDVIQNLARRVYDIRCRIVHSKSGFSSDGGPGLLPGTHHEDLVRAEIPLMEYLARSALIASAERLLLPAAPGFRSRTRSSSG